MELANPRTLAPRRLRQRFYRDNLFDLIRHVGLQQISDADLKLFVSRIKTDPPILTVPCYSRENKSGFHLSETSFFDFQDAKGNLVPEQPNATLYVPTRLLWDALFEYVGQEPSAPKEFSMRLIEAMPKDWNKEMHWGLCLEAFQYFLRNSEIHPMVFGASLLHSITYRPVFITETLMEGKPPGAVMLTVILIQIVGIYWEDSIRLMAPLTKSGKEIENE